MTPITITITITKIFESYLGKSIESFIWDDNITKDISAQQKNIQNSFKWLSVTLDVYEGLMDFDVSNDGNVKQLKKDVESVIDTYEQSLCDMLRQSLQVMDFSQILDCYFGQHKKLHEIGELLLIFDGYENKGQYAIQLNDLAKSDDVANKLLFVELLKSLTNEK